VNNERIKEWTLLRFETPRNSFRVESVGCQSVNSFGGQCDYLACIEEFKCTRDARFQLGRYDFCLQRLSRACRTSFAASSPDNASAVKCPIFRRGRASCFP